MDEAVIRKTRAVVAAALCGAGLLAAAGAGAQPLQDPTRPAVGGPGTGAALAASDAAPVQPQLQSVLVGRAPGGRRIAVIDGETVRLGDTFHGARVARVTDTEVELVRGGERQVLRLYAQQPDTAAPATPR